MMPPPNPRAVIEMGSDIFDSSKDKELVYSMNVDLTTDEASECEWRVFDPNFKFINRWTVADGIAVLPARVWLGFGDELGEPVFKGLLARVERGSEYTTFRFYDMGFKMRRVKKTEYHKNLDDVGIIAKLAKRNDLMFEGPTPRIKLDKHRSMMQDAQTDWEHAQERAEEAGLVLYVRGDTLFAKEAAKTGKPVATFTFRKDLMILHDFSLNFRVPENKEGRPRSVETRGRGRGGKRLRGKSTEHERGTTHIEIKRDLAIRSKRHADRRAEVRKALQREHAFTLSSRVLPTFTGRWPDVRDTVEILNVGDLFSGLYLCDRVAHSFAPGQLQTDLSLYRDVKE